jgi:prepilin-type N-terminal cleavage/methylation domain-containing protein
MRGQSSYSQGFTLIELAIVLVIIGLIVGGILVGQNLISAAAVRATITQVEKYNTAANTFREKYGYLPGDINATAAAQFGFVARGSSAGEGDGNGIIEGVNHTNGQNYGYAEGGGETVMFWVDLSTANLIDGGFSTASPSVPVAISVTALPNYFPAAKLGGGNYFYVFSTSATGFPGPNYFGLSNITNVPSSPCSYCIASSPGLTVSQAASIDGKVDDGIPQSGNVTATYLDYAAGWVDPVWAAGGGNIGASTTSAGGLLPTTAATAGSSTSCYDNSSSATGTPGVAGAQQHYSVEISNGANVNCALSFRMQAGD